MDMRTCGHVDMRITFRFGGRQNLEELRQIRQYGQSVRNRTFDHIFRIEQSRNAQLLLGHAKGQLIVVVDVLR